MCFCTFSLSNFTRQFSVLCFVSFQFYCEPKELHNVKKALEGLELNITDARLELIPHTFVKLSEIEMKVASSLLDAILDLDEVIRVYDNIEAPENKS